MKFPAIHRIAAGIGLLLSGVFAVADDNRPFYVEITEIHEKIYSVRWRIPPTVAADNVPQVELPETCNTLNSRASQLTIPAIRVAAGRANYRCRSSLSGKSIVIRFASYNRSVSSLIRYRTLTGEHHSVVLKPDRSEWYIPDKETTNQVAHDYTLLGVQHILGGADHLLFVVCLLWIAGTGRRILITITGFTLAHSATLALSALNVITVPVPPVEASIALSIVILASEIIKGQNNSLTWRYPISVSCVFGLLHGLGFAAALGEIGLPQTELQSGLLFFNIGVEIGQVLFAGAIILLIYAAKRVFIDRPKKPWLLSHARPLVGYGTGSIASFWLVEQCAGFL